MRLVVVGQGLIGTKRAQAILDLESELDVTLAATVDPVVDARWTHFADASELRGFRYDAAVVAVPHDLTASVVEEIVRQGKPVLIEKPMGVNLAEAHEIADMTSTLPLPSFVGFNYRFLPAVARAIRAVSCGALGTLRNIDLCLGHGGNPDSSSSWKMQPKRAGGGVLIDPGVHLIDLLLYFAPGSRLESIRATSGFWPTGIEEDVVATFSRSSGLTATLRASTIRWASTFRIEIFGESGYVICEGRGGNYGPQTYRQGDRWAWVDHPSHRQAATEERADYGLIDSSLKDELAAVIRAWLGTPIKGIPRPATIIEGLGVAREADQMYGSLV